MLSESTTAYDRGLKFEPSREIDTLREYLMVEQDRRHADLFRRGDDGRWVLEPIGGQDKIILLASSVALTLEEIYEDVGFPERAG